MYYKILRIEPYDIFWFTYKCNIFTPSYCERIIFRQMCETDFTHPQF